MKATTEQNVTERKKIVILGLQTLRGGKGKAAVGRKKALHPAWICRRRRCRLSRCMDIRETRKGMSWCHAPTPAGRRTLDRLVSARYCLSPCALRPRVRTL